eukprot:2055100-Pleurochrysis_carterae.AAC.2
MAVQSWRQPNSQFFTNGPGPPESFLERILLSNASPDAQVFTHAAPPFKVVHVNPAWTCLTGFAASEIVGQTCKILQGPETSKAALGELRGALNGYRTVVVRLYNYTKQGERFLNELEIVPLHDEQGITHFLGTAKRIDVASTGTAARLVQEAVAESAVAAAFNAQMPAPPA